MFKKIGFKLILAVGATAIVTIGVFSYYNIRLQTAGLLSEVERHANQLSGTVEYSTRYDMLLNQRDRIHRIINTISGQPGIRQIRILNKEGEIIYSSSNDEIGQMVDKKAESCYACHAADRPLERLSITERTRIFRVHQDSSRVLGIISPIYTERSCWEAECHAHSPEQTVLGVLDVAISLEDVDKQIQMAKLEIVYFAISAILAISLILGFFVRRWVGVPVKELLKATKQVGSGNLSYTIETNRNDDLGALAASFNSMTKKLSEARLQLFQSDKMASLGRLAAGVAHEINNPLTGVLTYSSFLLKRTEHQPEIHEDLKVIVREATRSREIVKSLLDFARQSVPKKHPADMNEIIERSIGVVENQLGIKQIKLIKHLDRQLPRITVDSNQMQQVLVNLLVNGADAIGPQGGTITISSSLLRLSPYGITQIKKAVCPKRHDLIDNEFKIDGMPSVRVLARSDGNEGFIHLDPVYGKNRNQFGIPLEMNKQIEIRCPECKVSLIEKEIRCPRCGAPIYTFEVPSQGSVEGCTRRGCDWQKWDAVDSGGQKEYAEIKISDTGSGIPKEDLLKIFEPFYSTKGLKGTGLGLAVSWGIIDNHNGSITVESEVGSGTTFTIRLPIK